MESKLAHHYVHSVQMERFSRLELTRSCWAHAITPASTVLLALNMEELLLPLKTLSSFAYIPLLTAVNSFIINYF